MDMIKDGRARGFTTVENAVIDTADLNVLEKMVYLVLSRFENGEEEASIENIAFRMGGVKYGQVKAALEGLIKKEYVEKEIVLDGEEGDSSIYYMLDLPESVNQFGDDLGGV